MVLVGTQDNISESSPRLIDDARARKLASDLKNCTYHETCATYGLNVERVFQDSELGGGGRRGGGERGGEEKEGVEEREGGGEGGGGGGTLGELVIV